MTSCSAAMTLDEIAHSFKAKRIGSARPLPAHETRRRRPSINQNGDKIPHIVAECAICARVPRCPMISAVPMKRVFTGSHAG